MTVQILVSAICLSMQPAMSMTVPLYLFQTVNAQKTVACKGLIGFQRISRFVFHAKYAPGFSNVYAQPPRFGEQCSGQEDSDGTDEEEEPLDFRPMGLTRRGKLQKLERQLKRAQEEEDGQEEEEAPMSLTDESAMTPVASITSGASFTVTPEQIVEATTLKQLQALLISVDLGSNEYTTKKQALTALIHHAIKQAKHVESSISS